ncbi:MAG: glycosyltransferase [Selenomonadaceae bacterium]|nr:glycosyltransferase [Selenomonadaceae bacterium]
MRKNDTPLVSVIMPVYNAEMYILDAISSVIQQTYSNWEFIIVEDCSTDNTREILADINDARIKILYNSKNSGIAYSTNKAIAHSNGKYIALLDDDDMAFLDRLEIQVGYMEENAFIDMLGGRTANMDSDGVVVSYGNCPKHNPLYIKAMLLFTNGHGISNGTFMIRHSFIEKHRLCYKDECYGMQDYLFLIDSSKYGNITSIEHFFLKRRVHDNNTTYVMKKKYGSLRAKKYAEFQRYSISASGFKLSDEQYSIINKAISEWGETRCDNVKELNLLYKVFQEMIKQGREMNIEYLDELIIVCKQHWLNQLKKMDLFDEGFTFGL